MSAAGSITRRAWLGGACLGACAGRLRGQGLSARVGLSGSMLGEVNLNDARAAIMVWMDTIYKQTGIRIVCDQGQLFDAPKTLAAVRAGQLEMFGITLHEYRDLAALVEPSSIVLDEVTAQQGQEYLILAHRDRGVSKLADLRGKQLLVFKNPVTSLASDWMDILLAEAGLGPVDRFFQQVSWQHKLSKVVLPVYFQQADACLTMASGYATMCEMNPQLGAKLTVLARSPRVVPSILGFHKSCPPAARKGLYDGLLAVHETSAGRQALALFQSRRLHGADISALRSSLELAGAAARLRGAAGKKTTG